MNSRFVIVLIFVLISFGACAQVQFALFAGPQATSARYTVSIDKVKQPTQFKYGLMGGVAAKVEFDNQFYFFPAIYYSLKGYKVTLNSPAFPPSENANNNNTTIHTIEVAPLFHYDFNKQPSHFFVRFGPSIDFAFKGREKFDTVNVSGEQASVDRAMVFSFGDYSWCTAQAHLHFGYETGKGLMIFAFYEHGFASMNNADDGPKIFHRIVGMSFGWLFGHNPLVMDTRTIR